jgi:hypothetical protein
MIYKRSPLLLGLIVLFCFTAQGQSEAKVGTPVVIEVKNGPFMYGRLIQQDAQSISITREGIACGMKLDLNDIAFIFDVTVADENLRALPLRRMKLSREATLSLAREVSPLKRIQLIAVERR